MTDYLIRRATVEDAPLLSALASQTFTETFGHLYPPEDLAEFLADAYDVGKQRVILSHPDYAVFLAEENGVPIGHSAAGPCGLPHEAVAADDGEIKRLYLVATHQNAGRGSHLFDVTLQWLLRNGPRTLWISVWSENFGAQRFYARHGFTQVGTYEFPVGKTRDLEFILRRQA